MAITPKRYLLQVQGECHNLNDVVMFSTTSLHHVFVFCAQFVLHRIETRDDDARIHVGTWSLEDIA